MRNTSGIQQDNNLSRYSYVSTQRRNLNHDVSQYFPDSTDNLVSEILKARNERLAKQKQEDKNEKVEASEQVINVGNYQTKQISEIMAISKLRSNVLNQLQLQRPTGIQNVPNSTSKQQKLPQLQPINDSEFEKQSSFQSNQVPVKREESHAFDNKLKQNHSASSSKILPKEEQHHDNQTKQQKKSQLEPASDADKHMDAHFTKSEIKFQARKANNLVNQSIDQHEKEVKISASRAISEAVSDYIELGMGKSLNPKSLLKQKQHQVSIQNDNIQNGLFQKTPESLEAVQSKIEAKQSQLYVQQRPKEQKTFYEFGLQQKKAETDREVVQALNDRLNQINEIQQAEINEAISKRISSERNQSSANFQTLITAQPEKKVDQANFVSEFETEYSDDLRDHNILQHHYQSNTTLLEKQITELLELYEGMIMEEECKQLRKKVKDAQLENRNYKIRLRNASYSKRFNFHSPIPKNNNIPLQFHKKFTVSPNLATQYYELVQKIADQKKELSRLQEQYKVISNFQELMKGKKISSYPPLPFDLQYDSQLGKYRTTKIGFFRKSSEKQLGEKSNSKKRYEFSKTKRTVKLQDEEINYYDLLSYKRDICRDTILEFQVFNLGRIKKLKDEKKLISKEIEFVDKKIEQVSKHIKEELAKIFGPKELPNSEYFIKSKKSFSRSPPVKSATRLLGIPSANKQKNSPSQQKIFSKKKISLTKSQEKDTFEKKQAKGKVGVMKPSIIPQLNDDYGLSGIRDANNQPKQIPTFGRTQSQKMLLVRANQETKRGVGSPMVRKVNYIKVNKELLTRTELNIKGNKSKEKMMSEQVSPIKKKASFTVSADDSKYSNI